MALLSLILVLASLASAILRVTASLLALRLETPELCCLVHHWHVPQKISMDIVGSY